MLTDGSQKEKNQMILSLMRGVDLKNVLCWVDSTDRQDWVVKVGKALADSSSGRCHAVMGLDSPSQIGSGKRGRAPLTPEIIALAGKRLSSLYGDEIHTMVLPGHPVAEIRRYARTRHIDLIVMREQALAVERAYGERLIESAPCMVMILATPEPEKRNQPFQLLETQETDNPSENGVKVTENSQR